jgi:hyperosmotically inducible protein
MFMALLLISMVAEVKAQERPGLSDRQIEDLLERRLAEKKIEGVRISVSEGIVTLTGRVRSAWARQRAIELAFEIPDVETVDSEVEIFQEESDEDLAALVSAHVRSHFYYTIYDEIGLIVKDGVVTLTGRVTMPYKALGIAEHVSRIRGVQDVVNEIRLLPTSSFDDQLRTTIAGRIYRDVLFWEYANRSDPPIHIIVENGRVSLVGEVRSEVERRQAEIITRYTFGVLSVNNRLKVARSS